MTGSIPASIENLKNLQQLLVNNNPGINGTVVSPVCGLKVYMRFTNHSIATNTSLSAICGCVASSNIPILMPNSDMVSMACLSVSNSDGFWFDCKFDAKKNPMQDCLNSLGFFCGKAHIQGSSSRIQGCKERIDDYFSQMGPLWIAWRRECGKWPWTDGYTGNVTSPLCAAAENNVKTISGYSLIVDSMKPYLWYNEHL